MTLDSLNLLHGYHTRMFEGPVNRFVRVSNIAGGVHIPASELKHVSIAPTGLSTCKVVNVDLRGSTRLKGHVDLLWVRGRGMKVKAALSSPISSFPGTSITISGSPDAPSLPPSLPSFLLRQTVTPTLALSSCAKILPSLSLVGLGANPVSGHALCWLSGRVWPEVAVIRCRLCALPSFLCLSPG